MKRGNTLVGLLAAVAVLAVLVVVFIGSKGSSLGVGDSTRKDGKGRTALGAARMAAKDSVCRERLNQVRQGIAVAQTTDDTNPGSLVEVPSLRSLSTCPIGGQAYRYDPATGAVGCPYPGHEKY